MVLRDVYSDAGDSRMPEKPFNRAQKRDLFQLNMVLAIGSIKLFHECPGTLHPFGFFTAALEVSSPSEFHFNQASDVENLLLIAHFGLFYNIGMLILLVPKNMSLTSYRLLHLGVGPSMRSDLHRITIPSIAKHANSHCYSSSKMWDSFLGKLSAGSIFIFHPWSAICSRR
jgi:hypothetical protein